MKVKVDSFTNPITEDVLQPKHYSNLSVKPEDTLFIMKNTDAPLPNHEYTLSYKVPNDFLISSIFISAKASLPPNSSDEHSHGYFHLKIDDGIDNFPDDFFDIYNGIIVSAHFDNLSTNNVFTFYFNTPVLIKKDTTLLFYIYDEYANELHIEGIIKGVFND